jgi:hypothetical protein
MNRNTVTTLGELREGDRFTHLKKKEAWEVMKQVGRITYVNLPGLVPGSFMYRNDTPLKNSTQVVFLRHTRPVAGDDVPVEQLKPGDVFHKQDDIITEYEVMQHYVDNVGRETKAKSSATHRQFFSFGTKVIFVRDGKQ